MGLTVSWKTARRDEGNRTTSTESVGGSSWETRSRDEFRLIAKQQLIDCYWSEFRFLELYEQCRCPMTRFQVLRWIKGVSLDSHSTLNLGRVSFTASTTFIITMIDKKSLYKIVHWKTTSYGNGHASFGWGNGKVPPLVTGWSPTVLYVRF
jgi:hypothetical protein